MKSKPNFDISATHGRIAFYPQQCPRTGSGQKPLKNTGSLKYAGSELC